jgi:glycosyltransferase involved in cell wall biosynthesis
LTDEHWPNSQAVAQSIHEALGYQPPMRMIPNHLYQAVPTDLPTPIAGRLVFVGQLIPEKGLDLLLDAVALLRADGRAVTLDVVGRIDGWQSPSYGSYRDDCLARGSMADVAGAVRWLGTRSDVPACLAAGALHVCPSRPEMLEGMPAVVIEAKAVGTPSVAFAHGPFPEMIEAGVTGWMTDEISSVALAQVLRVALDDPGLLDARRAAVQASVEPYRVQAFEHAVRDALAHPLPGIA